MARSVWKGAISFGLVNVPVRAYTAVSKKDVRFHQLHGATGARVRQKRVSTADGEEVPYEEIVKGYEISRDNYVIIEPSELDALDPKSTKTIDIEDFVELEQIDPIYYERPYYLVPDPGSVKPYALLLQAMRSSGKVAIARVVFHTKQHLVALRPIDGMLVMETMYFADEVVGAEDVDPDASARTEVEVSDRELTMAEELIKALTSDFEPGKYKDTYRERVLELIEQKAAGKQIVEHTPAEEPKVVDLMAALEASVAAMSRDKKGDDEKAPVKSKAKRSKSTA